MPSELKTKILITKSGYFLFFLIIPIMLVNDTYKIFSDSPPVIRITGGLIMSMFIVFYFIRNVVKKFINWLSPGTLKIVITSIYKSLPLVIVGVVLVLSIDIIKTFTRCYIYVAISLVIANIIDAFDDCYIQEWKVIKLTKQQEKLKGKYNL